ncbi:ABC transporter family substrate-binding protein [Isoptericola sp. NPDC056573]|uniref:ABC transporter family substrate-binding protein n=1 Tax=unclassified Isoptericola TaxID=2623355 RepID=UPI00367ACE2B
MTTIRKKGVGAVAAAAVLALTLAACGSGGGDDEGTAQGNGDTSMTTQPADGVPSSYQGALPMPEAGKAYNNPQDRENVKDGGTLTLPIEEVTPNWNAFSVDGNTRYMGDFWKLYQASLWDYDVAGNPTPNPDYLSKVEVTSKDPLVVTYDVNPKATWNDGTPIDWTAFEATWKAQSGKTKGYNPVSTTGYDQVKSVEKGKDDKQVVVTFDAPFFPYQFLFLNLMHPDSLDVKTYTEGWVNEPHNEWAAGPFIVDSQDETQATFVPNPKWWGETPKLEKIVFKQMEEAASINAFQNGEIDSTGVAAADRLKVARGMDDVQILINYALSTGVFTLNTKAEALQDIAVRKAVTQATDVTKLAEIDFQGLGWEEDPAGSEVMSPIQDGYENNMPADAAYSVENAKATLEGAGYTLNEGSGYYEKDGKPVHLKYTFFGDSPTQTAMANAVQAMLKAAGIEVELDNQDSSKFSDTVLGGKYEMLIMAWSSSDPYGYSTSGYQLYGSDSDSNFTYIGSKEIDELMKKPGTIEDIPQAVAAFNEAEKKALEQYGTFPIDFGPEMTAVKKGLANFGWRTSGFQGLAPHPENWGWQK